MVNARRAYQESAARGANPVRLTILLYEQMIQDVARAAEAVRQRQPEACAQEVGHAVAVIGYLQATLQPSAAESVSRNLSRFYTMIREQLMEAQVRSSRDIFEEIKRQLMEVREAWNKVESDLSAKTP